MLWYIFKNKMNMNEIFGKIVLKPYISRKRNDKGKWKKMKKQ